MEQERIVFERPKSLCDVVMHYCPGCIHGIAHRVIAEVMDEMGLREKTIGIAPVGCAVLAYNYFSRRAIHAVEEVEETATWLASVRRNQ